jgi:biopolymer transport protein ExbB
MSISEWPSEPTAGHLWRRFAVCRNASFLVMGLCLVLSGTSVNSALAQDPGLPADGAAVATEPAEAEPKPVTPPPQPEPAPAVVPLDPPAEEQKPAAAGPEINVWELLEAGGTIGWIIMALSVVVVALLFEHVLSVRRGTLLPRGLADTVRKQITAGKYEAASKLCQEHPSYVGDVLSAGLDEVALGYPMVEKAMEDAARAQAARLSRKLEYFTMIGTIAPMLGLLGTVWGMILAFMEFEHSPNPQPSQLAPGIYKALVTTLQGLCVAIPSLAAFSVLRNRLDELVAESTLAAERAFSGYKRSTGGVALEAAPEPRRSAEKPRRDPQEGATSS